jgi:hypothetical protein
MKNPADAIIAAKIGELELTKIRMAWRLEHLQREVSRLTALLVAKDAQIAKLSEPKTGTKPDVGEGAEGNGAAFGPGENLPAKPYATEARH